MLSVHCERYVSQFGILCKEKAQQWISLRGLRAGWTSVWSISRQVVGVVTFCSCAGLAGSKAALWLAAPGSMSDFLEKFRNSKYKMSDINSGRKSLYCPSTTQPSPQGALAACPCAYSSGCLRRRRCLHGLRPSVLPVGLS